VASPPCLTMFARNLISLSRRRVSDHCSTTSGKARAARRCRDCTPGREAASGQRCRRMIGRTAAPLDGALALFDPLFGRATLIVAVDDQSGAPPHVGGDEADPRIKLICVPLDLRDRARRLVPALSPITEGRDEPLHGIRWATDRPPEQIGDVLLQHAVRPQPGRIGQVLSFQEFVILGNARAASPGKQSRSTLPR